MRRAPAPANGGMVLIPRPRADGHQGTRASRRKMGEKTHPRSPHQQAGGSGHEELENQFWSNPISLLSS